uniref:Proopiomelanocortin n=1 Tax=Corvus macrorhynchos TaxID=36249 RepID=D4QGR0_CORMC|nr:proopiomelanocortin [Corvus macrorhynchos]
MGLGILPVALGLLLWNSTGASGPCWENSKCQDLSSEAGILACAGSCRARLSLEAPVFPGNGHLQPLSESLRRYVMSHFRWNQFGRRNSSNPGMQKREEGTGAEAGIAFSRRSEEARAEREEGKRSYSMEHFRWGKPVGRKRRPVKVYPSGAEEESAENSPLEFRREAPWEEEEEEVEEEEEEERFPWDQARKEKRYGGFMSSERIRTPLVTLFRNAIGKSLSKEGQ